MQITNYEEVDYTAELKNFKQDNTSSVQQKENKYVKTWTTLIEYRKNVILTKIVSEHNEEQLCCTSLKLKLLVALLMVLEHHFQV